MEAAAPVLSMTRPREPPVSWTPIGFAPPTPTKAEALLTEAVILVVEPVMERLKEKSNGRIVIKVFPASQMGPPPRQFDLARTGVADFAVVLHGLTPGRFPLMELAHVPGVLKAKSNYGGALALTSIAPEFASENPGVKIINILVTKTLLISRNEIKTAADLAGKRVRAAGSVQSDVLKAMGAGLGACRWSDIEVVRADSGAPSLVLHGTAQDLAASREITGWHLTMTHTHRIAEAIAVCF